MKTMIDIDRLWRIKNLKEQLRKLRGGRNLLWLDGNDIYERYLRILRAHEDVYLQAALT